MPVGVMIDHLAVPTTDARQSALFLALILGLPVSRDGADDEFYCLRLDAGAQILFTETQEKITPVHFALRVSKDGFDAVVQRLRAQNLRYGNDPENVDNGETTDPLGGHGRVYFASADGHLFEVCA